MIADLNVHWDIGEDGMPKPHAHVMLTMRSVDEDGFGAKVRDWNRTEMVEWWRERWAEHVNERLAELDIDARIDHRSFEAQGIGLKPQSQIGAPAQRRHGPVQRGGSPDLVKLGQDGRGEDRFTTRDMIEAEQRLHRAVEMMAERERHEVNEADREAALTRAEQRGLVLSGEQTDALAHVTEGRDLGIVVGYAGTGKSAMLGVAREAWEASGFEVRYVALSRHRDDMDLHYGRDDFAGQDKLINTLSRDRAKDMATDYEPTQNYAERRDITVHARDAAVEQVHARNNAVDRIGDIIFSVRESRDGAEELERETTGRGIRQEIEAVARDTGTDSEDALRHARRMALIRHAHAVGQVFSAEDAGGKASPGQWDELVDARKTFDAVRPYGWQDAEAAYAKDESLAHEAGSGKVNRAIRALQLETEIRTSPERRADRFVERFRDLKRTGERQYAAGNYSGYHAVRGEMGNMAMSLERDAQMDSLLEGRKKQLGISMDFDSGMRLGRQLALSHGIGRGRGIGL